MKQFFALYFVALSGIFSSNALAQNPTFDPATSLLTLPIVDTGGTTYINVVIRLDSMSVVSTGGSFPTVCIAPASGGGLAGAAMNAASGSSSTGCTTTTSTGGTTTSTGGSTATSTGTVPTPPATITTTTTSDGLTWTAISTTAYTWSQSDAYCSSASFNGLTGWRLPSRPEAGTFSAGDYVWTNLAYATSATEPVVQHWKSSSSSTGASTSSISYDYEPNYVTCVR